MAISDSVISRPVLTGNTHFWLRTGACSSLLSGSEAAKSAKLRNPLTDIGVLS
jgi:hypothetical protein